MHTQTSFSYPDVSFPDAVPRRRGEAFLACDRRVPRVVQPRGALFWSHQLCVYCDTLSNMPASDSESLSRHMAGIHNTSFALSSWAAQRKMIKLLPCPQLPPTPHRLARCLPLCDPGYHPNNERLHVATCRHTAQNPIDSSLLHHQLPHHSWKTTRKRMCFRSALHLLFLDGWTNVHTLCNRPSFCVSSCMNLGRLWCLPQRRRHCDIAHVHQRQCRRERSPHAARQ